MTTASKPNLGAHTATPADSGLRDKLVVMAKSAAREESLDPALVCAIAEQESGWDANAIRMEPLFLLKYVKPLAAKQPMLPTEMIGRSTSFGLMQLIGQVARELGFLNAFDSLCNPTVGLIWGCRHLSGLMRSVKEEAKQEVGGSGTADPVTELDIVRRTLLRYNGGADKAYADKVLARVAKYQ